MHKHINTNTDIIQVQCQNKSFTVNIYNPIPKTRQTQVNNFVKRVNVSNITQIYLLLPIAQPPQYLQLIHNIITESLMKQLVLLLVVLFLFQMPCCREIPCWPQGLIWCHCKPLAESLVVDICQTYFISGWQY